MSHLQARMQTVTAYSASDKLRAVNPPRRAPDPARVRREKRPVS
jgi:hypothetical protein